MIRIITDSTSDITLKEAAEKKIDIVSLYVHMEDKVYKDRVDLTAEDFYEKLKDHPSTTSQPSPADFLAVYNQYPEDEILCITCTHKLSGTYQSACIAKEDALNNNITIIDSNTISLGLRSIIFEAVRMRDQNCTMKEMIDYINEVKKKNYIIGSVDSLKYLKRGGRISGASAVVGSILNIKPILKISDGVIKAHDKKVRGKKNVIKTLCELVEEIGFDKNLPMVIGYSTDEKDADRIGAKLKEKEIGYNMDAGQVGPVVGTHVGPGCVFISFFTL